MNTFSYIVIALALIGGVLAMLVAKGRHKVAFRWVGVYLLWSFAVQAAAQWSSMTYKSNMVLYNLSIPVFFFILFMLFCTLDTPKAYRRSIGRIFLVWCVPLLVVLIPSFLEGGWASTTMSQGIVVINLTVVTVCLVYLYHMLQHPEATPPMQQAPFLVVMALFFYFLCSFLSWAAISLLSPGDTRLAEIFGYINMYLLLAFYLFLIGAVWVQYQGLKLESGKG